MFGDIGTSNINKYMKQVHQKESITLKSKIKEVKKLQSQINNLEMQIDDYQQIVKELSDKLELLKKFV